MNFGTVFYNWICSRWNFFIITNFIHKFLVHLSSW